MNVTKVSVNAILLSVKNTNTAKKKKKLWVASILGRAEAKRPRQMEAHVINTLYRKKLGKHH